MSRLARKDPGPEPARWYLARLLVQAIVFGTFLALIGYAYRRDPLVVAAGIAGMVLAVTGAADTIVFRWHDRRLRLRLEAADKRAQRAEADLADMRRVFLLPEPPEQAQEAA